MGFQSSEWAALPLTNSWIIQNCAKRRCVFGAETPLNPVALQALRKRSGYTGCFVEIWALCSITCAFTWNKLSLLKCYLTEKVYHRQGRQVYRTWNYCAKGKIHAWWWWSNVFGHGFRLLTFFLSACNKAPLVTLLSASLLATTHFIVNTTLVLVSTWWHCTAVFTLWLNNLTWSLIYSFVK